MIHHYVYIIYSPSHDVYYKDILQTTYSDWNNIIKAKQHTPKTKDPGNSFMQKN